MTIATVTTYFNKCRQLFFSVKRQLWVTIALVLMVCSLLSWYFLSPATVLLQKQIKSAATLAGWSATASATITQLQHTRLQMQPVKPTSLLAVVDHEAKVSVWRDYVFEMKQTDMNQIQLSFSRIMFDDLMRGVEILSQKDSIQVDKISVQRVEETDFVSASVLLKFS